MVALLGVLALAVVFVTVVSTYFYWTYRNALEETKVGDSYDIVIRRFGPPDKLERCPKFDHLRLPHIDLSSQFPKCETQIWYFYPLSRLDMGAWVVQFDEQRRVSGKEFVVWQ